MIESFHSVWCSALVKRSTRGALLVRKHADSYQTFVAAAVCRFADSFTSKWIARSERS
jgi:hypothetical protein